MIPSKTGDAKKVVSAGEGSPEGYPPLLLQHLLHRRSRQKKALKPGRVKLALDAEKLKCSLAKTGRGNMNEVNTAGDGNLTEVP